MSDSLEERVRAILAAKKSGAPKVVGEQSAGKSVQQTSRSPKSTTGRPRMNGTVDTTFVSHVEEVVTDRTYYDTDTKEQRPIVEKILERINLTSTGRAPSKKQVKLAASTRKVVPTNRVFSRANGCGPGDRNPVVSAIRAIAATGDGPDNGTGCIVRDETLDNTEVPTRMPGYRGTTLRVQKPLPTHAKPTTTRREGNEVAGYQVVQ